MYICFCAMVLNESETYNTTSKYSPFVCTVRMEATAFECKG